MIHSMYAVDCTKRIMYDERDEEKNHMLRMRRTKG
jgi:hypothetical protein